MYRLRILFISLLFVVSSGSIAQNISGTINTYAAVTGISAAAISVASSSGFSAGDRVMLIQMKGASIATSNNSTFGDITGMDGAGNYEFLDVFAVTASAVHVTASPTHTYNTSGGFVQLVRVPRYCMATVTSTVLCTPWSPVTGIGGIVALEAGTLTLNSDISADTRGFIGGNLASSGFCCNNGNYSGVAGTTGGQKGESISAYITGFNGLKGKQANGGGGANCGNSGGGGGSNGGTGGMGGNQYSGCNVDDRGVGGAPLTQGFSTLFMGGGGGGGFKDNGQVSSNGGNGGGIIYIKANQIVSNGRVITAKGGSITVINNDEGAGGGGAGGTIFLECLNFSGNLGVSTDGGCGGSNFNTIFAANCHGQGGGGAGGVFAYSTSSIPPGVVYSCSGGPAGTINNPASSCYNTTYGATAGSNGTALPNLPTVAQAYFTPTLSIVQSNTICSGQTATLSASGASSYLWNNGSISSFITVSPPATTSYTLFGYNGTCSASISYTTQVLTGPTLTVTGTPSVCSGGSATIAASGALNYVWSNGALADTIADVPVATTVYSVTGSVPGCSTTATHTVQVVVTPTVVISGPTSICNGQTAVLSVPSANTYLWNTGATTASIAVAPSSTSSYSATGANGPCTGSSSYTVTVIPLPTLAVSSTPSICTGASATLGVSGAASYSWSTGAVFPTVTVAPPLAGNATYTVTGTTNGCSVNSVYTLAVVSTPTLIITGGSFLCSGQSLTLNVSLAASYQWNTGATTSTIAVSPQASTSYSVLGANSTCTASAAHFVNVTPTPTLLTSVSNASICSGNSTQLTVTGASIYNWGNGSTHSLITVSPLATHVYTVLGTSNNCTSAGFVTVNVTPTPTLSTNNYTVCIGSTQATMTASGASAYVWSPNSWITTSTGPVVIANPPASMSYTVQGFNGVCTSSALVTVQAFSVPLVSISSSTDFVCKGYPVSLTATGADAYDWQPQAAVGNNSLATVLFVPSASAGYTVFGYTGSNCAGVATKSIAVLDVPELYINADSYEVCTGGSTRLYVSGADHYVWSPPDWLSSTTQSIVTAAPVALQVYTVTGYNGTAPYSCSSKTSLTVNVLPYASLRINAPDSLCIGERATLTVSGAKNYTWSPASFLSNRFSASPNVTPTTSVLYSVAGEASGFCASTQTVGIAIKPLPFADAGRDTTINFDQSVILNGNGNGWLYTWNAYSLEGLQCVNCPVTLLHPKISTCYVLEVENSHGCKAKDEVCVKVTNEYAIYIPNSFSPGSDGLNDVFMPLGFGVIDYTLFIYNRWGLLMFEGSGSFTDGRFASWDGTYKSERCKSDTYVYKFVYTLSGHKTQSREGQVLLLGSDK